MFTLFTINIINLYWVWLRSISSEPERAKIFPLLAISIWCVFVTACQASELYDACTFAYLTLMRDIFYLYTDFEHVCIQETWEKRSDCALVHWSISNNFLLLPIMVRSVQRRYSIKNIFWNCFFPLMHHGFDRRSYYYLEGDQRWTGAYSHGIICKTFMKRIANWR